MIRRLGAGLAVIWLASLPIFTAVRVPIWQSEEALWAEAVERSPLKPRPWVNYGRQAQLAGDLDLAEFRYEKARALALDSRRPLREQQVGWAVATLNLALVISQKGEWYNAAGLVREVRATYPRFVPAQHVAEQLGVE